MLLAGKGMLLTSDTPIASPPPPAPQVDPPWGSRMPENKAIPRTATCAPAETASGRPSCACSKNISGSACIFVERLRHDTHVADAGSLHCVHHRCEGAERNIFVGANEHGLMLRVADLLAQLG